MNSPEIEVKWQEEPKKRMRLPLPENGEEFLSIFGLKALYKWLEKVVGEATFGGRTFKPCQNSNFHLMKIPFYPSKHSGFEISNFDGDFGWKMGIPTLEFSRVLHSFPFKNIYPRMFKKAINKTNTSRKRKKTHNTHFKRDGGTAEASILGSPRCILPYCSDSKNFHHHDFLVPQLSDLRVNDPNWLLNIGEIF